MRVLRNTLPPPRNVPSANEHEIDIVQRWVFRLCRCGDVQTGLGDAPVAKSARQIRERCNMISGNHQRHQKVDKGQDKSRQKATKLQRWEVKQVIRDKVDILIVEKKRKKLRVQFNLQIRFF